MPLYTRPDGSHGLRIEMSPKMESLFGEKKRYRVAYGGRGGSKSYGFADRAIAEMCSQRTDIVACREYKTTITKSVHKLMKERIRFHGLWDAFDITDNKVEYRGNGSALIYQHLHNNYEEVRGLEGSDICWLFEAQDLQEESYRVLAPTIRRTPRMTRDPEIWVEWNPRYEDDFVNRRFITNQPDNCASVYITYLDNPYCPEDSKREAEQCLRENEEEYNHVWLGQPRDTGGLVYPGFDHTVHVRDMDVSRLASVGNFYCGQDPHLSYYPFLVWIARIPRDSGEFAYVVYNEWPTVSHFNGKLYHEVRKEKKCQLTLKERAKIFRVLDNTIDKTYRNMVISARGLDTRFAKGTGATSTTTNTRGIIAEMADPSNGGMSWETPREYMLDAQKERLKELMNWDRMLDMSSVNEPLFYVLPHCHNVIDTFRFHRYDRDGKETEDETRKDPSDAIRIALATAQEYSHVERRAAYTVQAQPRQDAVSVMVDAYMGGSYYGAGTYTNGDRRMQTPSAA